MSNGGDAIRATVERIFSAQQLFLPSSSRFREMVSPKGASGSPPVIPLVMVLNFNDVKQSVIASNPESIGDEPKQLALLNDALKSSSVVTVSKSEKGTPLVARQQLLRTDEDPNARTIFVKPIHPSASEKEISDFFAPFGVVEKISREVVVEAGGQHFKTGVSVQFATISAAETVSRSTSLTYGVLPNLLGNYFVPKITAMMQATHEQNLKEQRAKAEAELKREELAKAQRTAKAASAPAAAGAAPVEEIKKYLTPGRTLKCSNVPANVTWGQIKAKLGNLALDHPSLKGQIELVRMEGITAYVILKTVAGAQELLETFNTTLGEFMDDIRRICPALALVAGEEQSNVMRQYPMWASKKFETRVNTNVKRQRE